MLSPETIGKLVVYARYKDPQEMCGLLFRDETFLMCDNAAEDPDYGFFLVPHDYERACKVMGEKPWALVHSHPGKGAQPSAKDCLLMDALRRAQGDAAMSMVIVGLNPVDIRCFKTQGELYTLEWKHVPSV